METLGVLSVLMSICLLVGICTICMQCPQWPEGGISSSRTGGGCELPDVGARKQTQVSTRSLAASTLDD